MLGRGGGEANFRALGVETTTTGCSLFLLFHDLRNVRSHVPDGAARAAHTWSAGAGGVQRAKLVTPVRVPIREYNVLLMLRWRPGVAGWARCGHGAATCLAAPAVLAEGLSKVRAWLGGGRGCFLIRQTGVIGVPA